MIIAAYPVFVCKSQNAKEKFHSKNQANWHRKLKIGKHLKFNTCNRNFIPEILDSSDAYPQGCIQMKVQKSYQEVKSQIRVLIYYNNFEHVR